jgi:hypothetical protein
LCSRVITQKLISRWVKALPERLQVFLKKPSAPKDRVLWYAAVHALGPWRKNMAAVHGRLEALRLKAPRRAPSDEENLCPSHAALVSTVNT